LWASFQTTSEGGVEEDLEMVNENVGQLSWDDPSLSSHNPFRISPFLSIKLQFQSFAQEMGCSCTNLGFNGSFLEMSSFFLEIGQCNVMLSSDWPATIKMSDKSEATL